MSRFAFARVSECLDPFALPFLHRWYYQTLAAVKSMAALLPTAATHQDQQDGERKERG